MSTTVTRFPTRIDRESNQIKNPVFSNANGIYKAEGEIYVRHGITRLKHKAMLNASMYLNKMEKEVIRLSSLIMLLRNALTHELKCTTP